MNAKELRIGNLIMDYNDKVVTVLSINYISEMETHLIDTRESFSVYPLEDLNPIPLTEELILKFGFEKTYQGICKSEYNHNCNFIGLDFFKIDKLSKEFRFYNRYVEIDYVHQLQNLFFALTGEELTLNK